MADLGNLTNLVAQLTNRLNDIETNAKKIDELPPKSEITLSDKLHISDNGVSKYTTMGDVINSIQARKYDHLVSVESVTNVGNDVIITNAVAEINGNNVTNGTPVTLFVPYAATGYHRIDHVLIDATGQIYLYQGNETTGIAIEPAYVLGTVLITALDVSDNSLITGEPVIGDDFIKRSEQFFIQSNIINGIINLSNITESDKRYTNIKVMGGNNLSKVTYNFAYEGMRSLLWNATNANIQIVSGQTFMQNVTITPNQIIEFIYSGGKLYLEGGVGGATETKYKSVTKVLYPNITGPQTNLVVGTITVPANYFKINQFIRCTVKPFYENPGNLNAKSIVIANRQFTTPLYMLWGTQQAGGMISNGIMNHSLIDNQKRIIQRSGSGGYPLDIGTGAASTLSRTPQSLTDVNFGIPIPFNIEITINAADTLKEIIVLIELFENE